MKKTVLIALFTSVCAVHLMAQTDSVRVRLETSQGAEVGIDNDISSTNIMTKKVAVGKHIVSVTYGNNYRKDYEIEVTQTKKDFSFDLDGTLNITSQPPGATVFIDGMQKGKTPLSLKILGEHNLRLEGDHILYYNYTSRVAVKPFEDVSHEALLKKRPPRTYGMFLLNYEPIPDSHAVGYTLAVVKRWGAYLRFMVGTGDGSSDFSEIKSMNAYAGGPGYYNNPMVGFGSLNAGLMFRLNKHVYAYAGSGYGTYTKEFEKEYGNSIVPYGSQGVMADAGVILKWKALIAQVGYNRIIGEGVPSTFGSIYAGIGITIHKQRKD